MVKIQKGSEETLYFITKFKFQKQEHDGDEKEEGRTLV